MLAIVPIREGGSELKKSLFVTSVVLLVCLLAGAARADVVCGANCGTWLGATVCISSPVNPPEIGCEQWGSSCMSISSPDCGGGPGCGFNGELCGPREPEHQS